ncbi:MAG: hypothetical protein ACE5K0_10755 [Candidatus Methanofastidiosia archaeon]
MKNLNLPPMKNLKSFAYVFLSGVSLGFVLKISYLKYPESHLFDGFLILFLVIGVLSLLSIWIIYSFLFSFFFGMDLKESMNIDSKTYLPFLFFIPYVLRFWKREVSFESSLLKFALGAILSFKLYNFLIKISPEPIPPEEVEPYPDVSLKSEPLDLEDGQFLRTFWRDILYELEDIIRNLERIWEEGDPYPREIYTLYERYITLREKYAKLIPEIVSFLSKDEKEFARERLDYCLKLFSRLI